MSTGLLRKMDEPGYFRLMSQDGDEAFFHREDLRSIHINTTLAGHLNTGIYHGKPKSLVYRAHCVFVFTEELITGEPIEPVPVRKEFLLYQHENIEWVTDVVKEIADGVWGKKQ